MATEQAIGQGLSRVELFGQSTLAASREFDFLVYHKHQSLLDPSFGACEDNTLGKIKVAVGKFSNLALFHLHEVLHTLKGNTSTHGYPARCFDGAIVTGLELTQSEIVKKALKSTGSAGLEFAELDYYDLDSATRSLIDKHLFLGSINRAFEKSEKQADSNEAAEKAQIKKAWEEFCKKHITKDDISGLGESEVLDNIKAGVTGTATLTREAMDMAIGTVQNVVANYDDSASLVLELSGVTLTLNEGNVRPEPLEVTKTVTKGVSDSIAKLCHSLLRDRLCATYEKVASKACFGGRKGCGTDMGHHMLQSLLSLAEHSVVSSAFVFLDLHAAFYSVIRQGLFGQQMHDEFLCMFLARQGVSPEELEEW